MKLQNVELKVVGVTFNNEDGSDRQEIIKQLPDDCSFMIVRERHNKYDPNAIMVFANLRQIGYIGKEYAKILSAKIDAGAQFTVVLKDKGVYERTAYCHIIISEV